MSKVLVSAPIATRYNPHTDRIYSTNKDARVNRLSDTGMPMATADTCVASASSPSIMLHRIRGLWWTRREYAIQTPGSESRPLHDGVTKYTPPTVTMRLASKRTPLKMRLLFTVSDKTKQGISNNLIWRSCRQHGNRPRDRLWLGYLNFTRTHLIEKPQIPRGREE